MTKSDNLQNTAPIFESVLEVAVDKLLSKVSQVDGAGILQTELAKPGGNSIGEINLRLNPIQSPPPPTEVLEKSAYPEKSSSTSNTYSTVNNVSNVNNAVSNVISKLIDSSIGSIDNSEFADVRNTNIENRFPSAERVIDRLAKQTITNEVNAVKQIATDSFTAVSNLITKNLETTEKATNSTESVSKSVSDLFNKETASVNSASNTSVNSLVEDLTVRSKKMVDATAVNRILKPENPVQASMERLTRVLPESINNLNSTVSSINTSSAAGPITTNEGSKIDNSSNTTIVNNGQPTPQQPQVETKPVQSEADSQMAAHYLQAIYAAIISGKVKVKLEY